MKENVEKNKQKIRKKKKIRDGHAGFEPGLDRFTSLAVYMTRLSWQHHYLQMENKNYEML